MSARELAEWRVVLGYDRPVPRVEGESRDAEHRRAIAMIESLVT